MAHQDKLTEEKDEFVESLNLTPEKIREDLEKMKDIEGFPIGDVEDILELSDPPYYTAYPNPYIKDFIEMYGTPYDEETDEYDVEPFVGDVSEGKNEKIYVAHSYHTKVPPKAIKKYIKHYTKKGDLIFDGFCGSGMIGVAARSAGRYCILNDLSPIATFLSSNFNSTPNLVYLKSEANKILKKISTEFDDIYKTYHDGKLEGKINYVVWSDVYECPFCHSINTYWDFTSELNRKNIICPNVECHAEVKKNSLIRYKENNKAISRPVLINYSVGKKRFTKIPDNFDLDLIKNIEISNIPNWYPMNKIPDGYNLSQPKKSHQLEVISDFYTKRNLLVLSRIYQLTDSNLLKFIFTSLADRHAVIRNRCLKSGPTRPLSNTLYIPHVKAEVNIINIFRRKMNDIIKAFTSVNYSKKTLTSTQASNNLNNIPKDSIDYIFVDPPFGANIMYSELNFILESWLKVHTNNYKEAIKNEKHGKLENEYSDLIYECFNEFYRVLKPNRWITVEFHNSRAEIWKIIQKSIVKAGFVIAQVAILDKVQGTIHQDAKVKGSVKNDLVINAYKPLKSFKHTFSKSAGQNMEKKFIEMHLDKLPIERNTERVQQMLYSKLIAQYIHNNFVVRMDAFEFYEMLKNNFEERDGYWFNQDQIVKYEQKLKLQDKLAGADLNQRVLGISDEKSAIIWLTQFLMTSKTYDEVFIEFSKNLLTSDDKIPELKIILEENFGTEGGKYRLPSDIERAKKEELRVKRLMNEFNEIFEKAQSKRKIKEIRKEALLHGLMKLYKEKDTEKITLLGKRLDQNIIDSDDDISAIIDWAMYN